MLSVYVRWVTHIYRRFAAPPLAAPVSWVYPKTQIFPGTDQAAPCWCTCPRSSGGVGYSCVYTPSFAAPARLYRPQRCGSVWPRNGSGWPSGSCRLSRQRHSRRMDNPSFRKLPHKPRASRCRAGGRRCCRVDPACPSGGGETRGQASAVGMASNGCARASPSRSRSRGCRLLPGRLPRLL